MLMFIHKFLVLQRLMTHEYTVSRRLCSRHYRHTGSRPGCSDMSNVEHSLRCRLHTRLRLHTTRTLHYSGVVPGT